MAMHKLVRCPFCFDEDLTILYNTTRSDWVAIGCTNCSARGPVEATVKMAVAGWNNPSTSIPYIDLFVKEEDEDDN